MADYLNQQHKEYVIDLDKVNNSQDMLHLFPLLLRRFYPTFSEDAIQGMEHLFKDAKSGSEAARTMDNMYLALARQMAQNMDRQLLQAIGGRR